MESDECACPYCAAGYTATGRLHLLSRDKPILVVITSNSDIVSIREAFVRQKLQLVDVDYSTVEEHVLHDYAVQPTAYEMSDAVRNVYVDAPIDGPLNRVQRRSLSSSRKAAPSHLSTYDPRRKK